MSIQERLELMKNQSTPHLVESIIAASIALRERAWGNEAAIQATRTAFGAGHELWKELLDASAGDVVAECVAAGAEV